MNLTPFTVSYHYDSLNLSLQESRTSLCLLYWVARHSLSCSLGEELWQWSECECVCEHVCACGCDAGGRVERQIVPCHSSCILSVLPPSLLPWTLPTLFTLAWPHMALDTACSSFLGSHHPQRGLEQKRRSVLD